jgi:hypothetical protein
MNPQPANPSTADDFYNESLHPLQIERFRSMTGIEKHEVLCGLIATARDVARAGLRSRFPQATDSEIESRLARLFLHGDA